MHYSLDFMTQFLACDFSDLNQELDSSIGATCIRFQLQRTVGSAWNTQNGPQSVTECMLDVRYVLVRMQWALGDVLQ